MMMRKTHTHTQDNSMARSQGVKGLNEKARAQPNMVKLRDRGVTRGAGGSHVRERLASDAVATCISLKGWRPHAAARKDPTFLVSQNIETGNKWIAVGGYLELHMVFGKKKR